jgi:hypothetical protein
MDPISQSPAASARSSRALGAALACALAAPTMVAADAMDAVRASPAFVAALDFADAILAHGRDIYGLQRTALIVGQLNARTQRLPERTPADPGLHADDPDTAGASPHHQNLMYDLGLLDLLGALSRIGGDERYEQARRAYLADFMARCRDPRSGYFAWGEHIGYDVVEDRISGGGRGDTLHEIKGVDVPWEALWQCDAEATRHEIQVAFRAHVCDERTFAFNRHAAMDGRTNAGWMLPTSLANSGGLYLLAWTWLSARTGEPEPLEWARRMDAFFWSRRHPATGLFPSKEGSPNALWYIDDLQYASLLMRASQEAGSAGADFREHALAYVHAYAAAAWDERAGGFINTLDITTGRELVPPAGRPLPPELGELRGRPRLVSAWCSQSPSGNYAVRILAAAAVAYEATGDAGALALFERAAGLMGLAQGVPEGVQPVPSELASAIHALLAVARRSGERRRIDEARRLVDFALSRMRVGGLFVVTAAGQPYYCARAGCGSLAAAALAFAIADAGLDEPRLRTRDLIGDLH